MAWGRRTDRPQKGTETDPGVGVGEPGPFRGHKKSQAKASSSPPVTAASVDAPISGLVRDGHGGPSAGPKVSPLAAISARSRPAQKAGSAPVITATSTWSSASVSSSRW